MSRYGKHGELTWTICCCSMCDCQGDQRTIQIKLVGSVQTDV